MSENIGALMDEYDEASKEFRQTESKDSFKRKCNAYEAIAKTVYILETQLAAAQSRLAGYEVGFDPATNPPKDGQEVVVLVTPHLRSDALLATYDADGEWFDSFPMHSWKLNEVIRWFPLSGSKGGEE